ncbi:MAG: M6 family metalloprotease domain-containing protein [Endomicrobia bacterium]|nr:M6 family metalloprotease domain-containing protein [Endomicrobiia bacterium]
MKKVLIMFSLTLTVLYVNIFCAVIHISGDRKLKSPLTKVKLIPNIIDLKMSSPAKKAEILGSIGQKKIAVIVVDFPDKSFSYGWHSIANEMFNGFVEYYKEVSYDKLVLQHTFIYDGGTSSQLIGDETPYRMSKSMSYYGVDTESRLTQLIKDALIATNGAVTRSLYDYVMVLHAGYGNESTTNSSDIWSVYIEWEDSIGGFSDGTIVPEKEQGASALGVVCHEFGHQLGLPDLYYDQESKVGCWCLMDNGVWLGVPQGSKPSHLSIWAKQFLGWVDLRIISSTLKNITLDYIENSSYTIKIPIVTANNPDKEYFLLEYRKKVSFDESLPASGLLVWRIDDEIATSPVRLKNNDINSGIPHLAIDLITADQSLTGAAKNDSGDPFPGKNNITSFVPQKYKITAYNGNPININITEISIYDDFAMFNILSLSGLLAKISTLDGIFLDDVKVYVYNTNFSTYSFSSKGYCLLELSTGTYNLQCFLENYTTHYSTIEIYQDSLLFRDIILRYDPSKLLTKNKFVIGNNNFNYNNGFQKISFRYNLSSASTVEIMIYDVSGRIVNKIEKFHSTSGYYEELWKPTSLNGEQLNTGVYFVCFKTDDSVVIDKFIVEK